MQTPRASLRTGLQTLHTPRSENFLPNLLQMAETHNKVMPDKTGTGNSR